MNIVTNRYNFVLAATAMVLAMTTLTTPAQEMNPMQNLQQSMNNLRQKKQQQATAAAERILTLADKTLQEQAQGFAALYQQQIEKKRDSLSKMVEGSHPGADPLRDAVARLNETIMRYRKIRNGSDIQPVNVKDKPAVLTWNSQPDWAKGLLVDVEPQASSLTLPDDSAPRLRSGGDYIEMSMDTSDLPDDDRVTMAFWLHPDNRSGGTVIEGNVGGSGNERWEVLHSANINFKNHGSNSHHVSSPSGSVPAGKWTHIAITYDKENTTLQIYINGSLATESTSVPPYPLRRDGNPLRIGGKTKNTANRFRIRQFSIWHQILSYQDIRSLMNRDRLSGEEENLIAYWPLDEGTGTVVQDETANGYDGEIKGTPKWVPVVNSGYHICQPISFNAITTAGDTLIEWAAAKGEDDGQQTGITVLAGLSESPQSLPDSWQEAENGKPIPAIAEGSRIGDKYLWIKQNLSRQDTAPVLEQLKIRVEGE